MLICITLAQRLNLKRMAWGIALLDFWDRLILQTVLTGVIMVAAAFSKWETISDYHLRLVGEYTYNIFILFPLVPPSYFRHSGTPLRYAGILPAVGILALRIWMARRLTSDSPGHCYRPGPLLWRHPPLPESMLWLSFVIMTWTWSFFLILWATPFSLYYAAVKIRDPLGPVVSGVLLSPALFIPHLFISYKTFSLMNSNTPLIEGSELEMGYGQVAAFLAFGVLAFNACSVLKGGCTL